MIIVIHRWAQSGERAQFMPLLCRVSDRRQLLATPRIHHREVTVLAGPVRDAQVPTAMSRADTVEHLFLALRWPPIDDPRAAIVSCPRNSPRDIHPGVICRSEHQNHIPALLKREKECQDHG